MGAVVGKGWLGLEALALFFDMVMVLIWKLASANIFEKFLNLWQDAVLYSDHAGS